MDNYLSISPYIIPFLLAFVFSLLLTYLIRRLALQHQIVDMPQIAPGRKVHRSPVPLMGGLAIFLSVVLTTAYYALFTDRVFGGYMLPKFLIGMLIAGVLLMIGGWLDDKFNLKPSQQVIWPITATLVIIIAGIGVSYITNPLGGTIDLESIKIRVLAIDSLPYYFVVLADIFAFFWLMGMMYTTKFLDGLDGLVAGVTSIGAVILFFLSLNQTVAQPETALLAIILAGAILGFLIFNWHPAKVFLGEGGSLWLGFMLGILAIISGAKIATALLIMGIPILDVVWVIVRRTFFEKKSPFKSADKKHLHFRLLDIGFSHRQTVLFLYFITLLFGSLALFLKGEQKLVVILILTAFMVILGVIIVLVYRHQKRKL